MTMPLFDENMWYNISTLASVNVTIRVNASRPNIVVGVVLCFIIACTIAGNVLVFAAIAYKKRLRIISNMFIVSLSMADLLLGTIVMVPAMLNEVFGEWKLARGFCAIWASFDVMLCSASVLNVCLISLDRYIIIMQPLRYHSIMTLRRTIILLAVAWTLVILASFIPVANGWHNPEFPSVSNLSLYGARPRCVLVPNIPFALGATTVTIFLPLVITFALYYRVSREAKRQAYLMKMLITPSILLTHGMASKPISEPFTYKATVTLGTIVGAYVVTWSPFLVSNVTQPFCKCIPEKVLSGFVWLGYCNSLVNPIIYPLFMRDFRKVYTSIFLQCCPFLSSLKHYKTSDHDPVDDGQAGEDV